MGDWATCAPAFCALPHTPLTPGSTHLGLLLGPRTPRQNPGMEDGSQGENLTDKLFTTLHVPAKHSAQDKTQSAQQLLNYCVGVLFSFSNSLHRFYDKNGGAGWDGRSYSKIPLSPTESPLLVLPRASPTGRSSISLRDPGLQMLL